MISIFYIFIQHSIAFYSRYSRDKKILIKSRWYRHRYREEKFGSKTEQTLSDYTRIIRFWSKKCYDNQDRLWIYLIIYEEGDFFFSPLHHIFFFQFSLQRSPNQHPAWLGLRRMMAINNRNAIFASNPRLPYVTE